jgi:hypothetical protein
MKMIQVFDPPMCCSTGVCGPEIDPVLASFSGFLSRAREQGCAVDRFNLAQQPIAFVENEAVRGVIEKEGVEALPMVFVDGELKLKGRYPDEAERSAWLST